MTSSLPRRARSARNASVLSQVHSDSTPPKPIGCSFDHTSIVFRTGSRSFSQKLGGYPEVFAVSVYHLRAPWSAVTSHGAI
jgi:hypothetical protein